MINGETWGRGENRFKFKSEQFVIIILKGESQGLISTNFIIKDWNVLAISSPISHSILQKMF